MKTIWNPFSLCAVAALLCTVNIFLAPLYCANARWSNRFLSPGGKGITGIND